MYRKKEREKERKKEKIEAGNQVLTYNITTKPQCKTEEEQK